jgi:hypothetical protein
MKRYLSQRSKSWKIRKNNNRWALFDFVGYFLGSNEAGERPNKKKEEAKKEEGVRSWPPGLAPTGRASFRWNPIQTALSGSLFFMPQLWRRS